MACSLRTLRLALGLAALLDGTTAAHVSLIGRGASKAQGKGQGQGSSSALLADEVRAFESDSATLDSEGWQAFMETSAHSARSEKDRSRHQDVDDAVQMERSFDLSVSDHFASQVDEQSDMPTLRELAKEHWSAIEGMEPKQPAAKAPATAQAAAAEGPSARSSLRKLLMSAGHSK
mmetsp:Transcript_68365/g.154794  ORF Transcript_68365/g.154794 Transcript_68365/m.154794 type:complete len:176 (-) Transcript_68365:93-620(-)